MRRIVVSVFLTFIFTSQCRSEFQHRCNIARDDFRICACANRSGIHCSLKGISVSMNKLSMEERNCIGKVFQLAEKSTTCLCSMLCHTNEQVARYKATCASQAVRKISETLPNFTAFCCDLQEALIDLYFRLEKEVLENLLISIRSRYLDSTKLSAYLRRTVWCRAFHLKCLDVVAIIQRGCKPIKNRERRNLLDVVPSESNTKATNLPSITGIHSFIQSTGTSVGRQTTSTKWTTTAGTTQSITSSLVTSPLHARSSALTPSLTAISLMSSSLSSKLHAHQVSSDESSSTPSNAVTLSREREPLFVSAHPSETSRTKGLDTTRYSIHQSSITPKETFVVNVDKTFDGKGDGISSTPWSQGIPSSLKTPQKVYTASRFHERLSVDETTVINIISSTVTTTTPSAALMSTPVVQRIEGSSLSGKPRTARSYSLEMEVVGTSTTQTPVHHEYSTEAVTSSTNQEDMQRSSRLTFSTSVDINRTPGTESEIESSYFSSTTMVSNTLAVLDTQLIPVDVSTLEHLSFTQPSLQTSSSSCASMSSSSSPLHIAPILTSSSSSPLVQPVLSAFSSTPSPITLTVSGATSSFPVLPSPSLKPIPLSSSLSTSSPVSPPPSSITPTPLSSSLSTSSSLQVPPSPPVSSSPSSITPTPLSSSLSTSSSLPVPLSPSPPVSSSPSSITPTPLSSSVQPSSSPSPSITPTPLSSSVQPSPPVSSSSLRSTPLSSSVQPSSLSSSSLPVPPSPISSSSVRPTPLSSSVQTSSLSTSSSLPVPPSSPISSPSSSLRSTPLSSSVQPSSLSTSSSLPVPSSSPISSSSLRPTPLSSSVQPSSLSSSPLLLSPRSPSSPLLSKSVVSSNTTKSLVDLYPSTMSQSSLTISPSTDSSFTSLETSYAETNATLALLTSSSMSSSSSSSPLSSTSVLTSSTTLSAHMGEKKSSWFTSSSSRILSHVTASSGTEENRTASSGTEENRTAEIPSTGMLSASFIQDSTSYARTAMLSLSSSKATVASRNVTGRFPSPVLSPTPSISTLTLSSITFQTSLKARQQNVSSTKVTSLLSSPSGSSLLLSSPSFHTNSSSWKMLRTNLTLQPGTTTTTLLSVVETAPLASFSRNVTKMESSTFSSSSPQRSSSLSLTLIASFQPSPSFSSSVDLLPLSSLSTSLYTSTPSQASVSTDSLLSSRLFSTSSEQTELLSSMESSPSSSLTSSLILSPRSLVSFSSVSSSVKSSSTSSSSPPRRFVTESSLISTSAYASSASSVPILSPVLPLSSVSSRISTLSILSLLTTRLSSVTLLSAEIRTSKLKQIETSLLLSPSSITVSSLSIEKEAKTHSITATLTATTSATTTTRIPQTSMVKSIMPSRTQDVNTSMSSIVPSIDYTHTFLVIFDGICPDRTRQDAFKKAFTTTVRWLIGIENLLIDVIDIKCGSTEVLFSVTCKKSNQIPEILQKSVRQGKFLIKWNGMFFKAFNITEWKTTTPQPTISSTSSKTNPTVTVFAKTENEKRAVKIIFILFVAIFVALTLFGVVICIAKSCGRRRYGKLKLHSSTLSSRGTNQIYKNELELVRLSPLHHGADYYGGRTVQPRDDDDDDEKALNNRTALLNRLRNDEVASRRGKIIIKDDDSYSSIAFY